ARVDAMARDVGERLLRGAGAVARVRQVVHAHARQPLVLPAAAVVEVEADVLGGAGRAEIAAVAGRPLDGDRRLEVVRLRVEADARRLLEERVADDLLDG